jgi:Tfp pilus assembly protein PilF
MTSRRWIPIVIGAAVVTVGVAAWYSRSAQSFLERGNAYLAKGNVDGAVLEYRNATEKDPTFVSARLKLGEFYLKQGNGAGALAEYVRAADLLPNDADAQM